MSATYKPPQVEHLVMVGVDWWRCLCWDGSSGALKFAGMHADHFAAETVSLADWKWIDVCDIRDPWELHEWLWEQGVL